VIGLSRDSRSFENSNACQGCTTSGCQVSMATKFCTVVTNICWCSVLELSSGTENFKMDPGFLENFSASSNNLRFSQDTVAVAICQFRAHSASYSAVGRVGCVVERFGVRWSSFSVKHRVISWVREGVQLHAFLISTLGAWCVVSLTPRPAPHPRSFYGKSPAVCVV
jgi:hypothetical protein